jgi:tetratricopeptide (TPR) repeat protein
MSAMNNIRAARLQLALALWDQPDRCEEAEAELHRALTEPGDEPPDWRLHLYLGGLSGDRARALAEVIAAVLAVPAADEREPADAALALLDGPDAPGLAASLDARDVRKLAELAAANGARPASVKLAAHISSLRGDVHVVRSLLASSTDPQVRYDPDLRAASAVTRALDLVDKGDDRDALTLLAEHDLSPGEPAGVAARALALYGLGELDQALDLLNNAPSTFDIAATRSLVWLRRAASTSQEERTAAFAEAERAASEAVRIDPSLEDGLLLRAQVTLESSADIDGGRKLLRTALGRLGGEPEQTWLWRMQQRVRDDDLFRYVALEVAAACGRVSELMRIDRDELPLRTTTAFQDGALAELVADAHRGAERLEQAEPFYVAAVQFYDLAGRPDLALRARQILAEIRPTVARSLELAEKHWVASFTAEEQGREEAHAHITQGLAALDYCSQDQEPSERAHSAYMRGLLLARAAQTAERATRRDRWAALTWLLVAALDDPGHSYRAAHLAAALGSAQLYRPAAFYADRALSLTPDDEWIQELVIVMRLSWRGTLDADTRRILNRFGNQEWREAIRAYDAVLRGNLAGIRKRIESITLDVAWAEEVHAAGVSRLQGAITAEPRWRKLLDLSMKQEPPDHLIAAHAALALRDADAAREAVDAGLAAGTIGARAAQATRTLVDLVADNGQSIERALACFGSVDWPCFLREHAHMLSPALTRAWAARREVAEALGRLRKASLLRLNELLAEPSQPLTVEMDADGDNSSDPALDRLVRQLLQIEETRGYDLGAAQEALRRLVSETRADVIEPALASLVIAPDG